MPTDLEFWKIDNYPSFLEARKERLAGLSLALSAEPVVVGGTSSEEEDAQLEESNAWVAVLLNEGKETFAVANAAGSRCFERVSAFKRYVEAEILVKDPVAGLG